MFFRTKFVRVKRKEQFSVFLNNFEAYTIYIFKYLSTMRIYFYNNVKYLLAKLPRLTTDLSGKIKVIVNLEKPHFRA